MIIEKHPIYPKLNEILVNLLELNPLFFDIETTGFSADTSHLYMIGCAWHTDGQWYTIQWFDETGTFDGEHELLMAFSEFCNSFDFCISFNGKTFDFPFIHKKCDKHDLPFCLDHMIHRDLYSELRPYRHLLKLESMKQKNIEQFLGIMRKDIYSGGELIPVYNSYIKNKCVENYQKLLLHNKDDLLGMTDLIQILGYIHFFNGEFKILSTKINDDECEYEIALKNPAFILMPISITHPLYTLSLSAYTSIIKIKCIEKQLKYFIPDYKNYYYLPKEDTAIHKSVAIYVDASCRQKATAQNCYIKKEGVFLPWFDLCDLPHYKETPRDSQKYIEITQFDQLDLTLQTQYLKSLILAPVTE